MLTRLGLAIALSAATLGAVAAPVEAHAPAATHSARAGLHWQAVSPAVSPRPEAYASMAYDAKIDRIVLFGGNNCCGGSMSTWLWDGSAWADAHADIPGKHEMTSMAYDAARQEVVLFGGTSDGSFNYRETWVFDGTIWTERKPETSPPAEYGGTMVYDPINQNVVLFGGHGIEQDTWTWDGTNWTQQHPAVSPPARFLPFFAYSRARGAAILYGGQDEDRKRLHDLWAWDGKTWTKESLDRPRFNNYNMGMSELGRQVVMFGGQSGRGGVGFSDRTSILREDRWKRVASEPSPSRRAGLSMAYDSTRHEVVMFGGGGEFQDDTWVLSR